MANSAALLAGTATAVSRNSFENYSSGDQGEYCRDFDPEMKLISACLWLLRFSRFLDYKSNISNILYNRPKVIDLQTCIY